MSKLIMMVGIPGSGKSTYIKNHFPNIVSVSRDAIRFEILDEKGGEYFDYEKEVFNSFVRQIIGSLVVDEVTIADATHLNKNSRAKLLNKVRQFADEIEVIFMDVDLITAIERNDKREGHAKVPRGVIRRMFFQLEAPEENEGFNKITIIREED